MADKPILFSGPMVRALLAGTKTQTRRTLNPQPDLQGNGLYHVSGAGGGVVNVDEEDIGRQAVDYLRIGVGDRLYVRESHYLTDDGDYERVVYAADEDAVQEHLATIDALPAYFSADLIAKHKRLRPSIHMPRWASRITLIVTDVRVERLQDISHADAIAEGCPGVLGPNPDFPDEWDPSPVEEYRDLWDSINGAGSWEQNPFVAVYGFDVHLGNIDQMEAA